MGSLRGDNGGTTPNGGGLPDLPPEWGVVIIPDDPAELAQEASQIRRELRWHARSVRWRRRLHLPVRRAGQDGNGLALPLMIMAIALVATLTSLFALAWPGSGAHPATGQRRTSASPGGTGPQVADVTLVAPDGSQVQLRNSLPAVVLLTDGCTCTDLELSTARAVPAGVTVLAVARQAPALPGAVPAGLRLRSLADPDSHLRTMYGGSPPVDGPIAILVKGTGEVIRKATGVTKVDDFATDLAKLS